MHSIFKLCLTLLCFNVVKHLHATRNRVFGGRDLRHDIQKYLVRLEFRGRYKSSYYCSGSILAPRWVITSAHCFAADLVGINVYHHIRNGMQIIAKGDTRKIVWHPEHEIGNDFLEVNRDLDVALFKTKNAIEINNYVQPIRLATRAPSVGQSAIITGYGVSEASDMTPKEGVVVLIDCKDGLLCSEGVVRAGDGDSGGALVMRRRLAGVTSASCRHEREPQPCLTVYVDIAQNYKWIRQVIGN